MDYSTHLGFHQGQSVEVVSDDAVVMAGTITKMASSHAEVTGYDGVVEEVPYGIMRASSFDKTAQRNRIKEEEKDGKKFALDKEEKNIDNKMSVRYKVTVDGKEIWSSEELVTNVYDNEFGWSAPDDFDEGKLDLIQKTAESGFDLVVESFQNIQDLAAPAGAAPGADKAPAPEGKPAFAPGSPGAEGGEGAMSGGMGGGGEGPSPEGSPEGTGVEGETVSDTGVPVEETTKAAPEIPAEAETAEPVATAASLTFSRRIVSGKKTAALSSEVTGTVTFDLDGQEYEFDYTATLHYQEDVRNDVVALEPTGGIEGDELTKYNEVLMAHEDEIRMLALEDAYSKMAQGSKKVAGILALAKDQRLHNNPEHRLNPVLRDEMKRRNIDSGNTNDLELADKLKGFDWSKKGSKKTAGKEYVIWGIPEGQDFEQLLLEAPGGERITDRATAEKYVKQLESKFKAKKLRIQELDLSKDLDWMKETGLKASQKTAGGWGRLSEDLSDVLEAQVLMNKTKSPDDIFNVIKNDQGILDMMRDEDVTDDELRGIIDDALVMAKYSAKKVASKIKFIISGGGDYSVGIRDIDATVTVEDNLVADAEMIGFWKEMLAEQYDVPVGAVYTEEELKIREKREATAVLDKKTASNYATLNDAADAVGNPGLAAGTTEIWYTTFDSMRDFGMGYDWLVKQMIVPTKESLPTTHKLIGKIQETDLDKIFYDMQGENWSPEGQAFDLIKGSGASHTSMSVGDVVVIGDTGYLVDRAGFTPLWGSATTAAIKGIMGALSVELSAKPNKDFDRDVWQAKVRIKPEWKKVQTLSEAVTLVADFIKTNELGFGNWTGGKVVDDTGEQVATISYNGRVWEPGAYPTPEIDVAEFDAARQI